MIDKKEIAILILGIIVFLGSTGKLVRMLDTSICRDKLEFMELKGDYGDSGCYVTLESGKKVLLANYYIKE